jgi:hypothetical protein
MFAELEAHRIEWEASEAGRAESARVAAETAELEDWIASDPGVEIDRWGGLCPEIWEGRVDGHSFFFRGRHGSWRIELDLRPTGRFYERIVWPDDPEEGLDLDRTEQVEVEEGDVIAQGIDADLGVSPLHHGRFIVNTIRVHLRRVGCAHPGARQFCPECGVAVASP